MTAFLTVATLALLLVALVGLLWSEAHDHHYTASWTGHELGDMNMNDMTINNDSIRDIPIDNESIRDMTIDTEAVILGMHTGCRWDACTGEVYCAGCLCHLGYARSAAAADEIQADHRRDVLARFTR